MAITGIESGHQTVTGLPSVSLSGLSAVAQGSVTARTLATRFADVTNIKDYGAAGDGTTDDRAAISDADTDAVANGTALLIPDGLFRVSSNITISSPVVFEGGALTVDTGVTVTFSDAIREEGRAIFYGLGTVKYEGRWNIAWFDGSSINAKWDALKRGLTTAKHYSVLVDPPQVSDAAYSYGDYGAAWALTAPIEIDDIGNVGDWYMNGAWIRYANNLECAFKLGVTNKTEVLNFYGVVRAVGTLGGTADPDGTGTASEDVFKVRGCGHLYIQRIECWNTGSAVRFIPTVGTTNNSVIGSIYSARQTSPVVYAIGADASHTVTEAKIGPIYTDGTYSTTPATSVVYLKGAVQNFQVESVTLRAVAAGHSDVSTAKVLLENNSTHAPTELIRFGSITSGSSTAKLLQARDTTSTAGPKIGGLVLQAAPWASGNIDLAWTTDASINNISRGTGTVTVDSTCEYTKFTNVPRDSVTDSGSVTLFDGRLIKRWTSVADDTAVSIALPAAINHPFRAFVTALTGAVYYGEARLQCRNTLQGGAIGGGANFVVTTGALTGTTGTDVRLTISADTGVVYVENRTGGSIDIDLVLDIFE